MMYGGKVIFSDNVYNVKHPYVDFWNDASFSIISCQKTKTFNEMRRDLTLWRLSDNGRTPAPNTHTNCTKYIQIRNELYLKTINRQLHRLRDLYLPHLLTRFFDGVKWISFLPVLKTNIIKARFITCDGNEQKLLVELESQYLVLRYSGS